MSTAEEHPSMEGKVAIVGVQVRVSGWRSHGRQLIARRAEWNPITEGEDGIVEVQVRVSGWRRHGRRPIVWRAE